MNIKPNEIIEMARQADVWVEEGFLFEKELNAKTIAFAKLVAAKTESHYMQLFLDPENQPTQFGTATQEYREQEIKDEREACAELMERQHTWITNVAASAAIRARGEV